MPDLAQVLSLSRRPASQLGKQKKSRASATTLPTMETYRRLNILGRLRTHHSVFVTRQLVDTTNGGAENIFFTGLEIDASGSTCLRYYHCANAWESLD